MFVTLHAKIRAAEAKCISPVPALCREALQSRKTSQARVPAHKTNVS